MSISIKSCFGWPQSIMLATTQCDIGIVARKVARRQARIAASEIDQVVYLHDPITDKVLDSFNPKTGRWKNC